MKLSISLPKLIVRPNHLPKPSYRGTGRTFKLVQGCPQSAVFVVQHHAMIGYTRMLCWHLKREDITVVTKNWLTENKWQGVPLTGIILDHDVQLTEQIVRALQLAKVWIKT
jgi:hypothetical protein